MLFEKDWKYSRLQLNWQVSTRWLLKRSSGNKTYCNGRSKMKIVKNVTCIWRVCISYIHVLCAMHRHYRSKFKTPTGTSQNFYSESIFRDGDQIRSRDVRSKYTYSPARALSIFSLFLYSVSILTANITELWYYVNLPEIVTIYSDNNIAFRRTLFYIILLSVKCQLMFKFLNVSNFVPMKIVVTNIWRKIWNISQIF